MRFLIAALSIFAIAISAYFFLPTYRSAFEADQACHFNQWELYGDSSKYGCDHDLETSQWLLFEKGENHQVSKVIKRFNY